MNHRSDAENYFKYQDLLREVQCMIAELASQSRNNPSYQHIWQVYQKAIEFERNEREVSDMLYDSLPQILSEPHGPAGQSQNLLNDRDGILLCEKASNAYESIGELLKQVRQLAVRSASDTATTADRANMKNQIDAHYAEIDRIIASTTYNGETILDSTSVGTPTKIQVGPFNTSSDQISLTLFSVSASGAAYPSDNSDADKSQAIIDKMDTQLGLMLSHQNKVGSYINSIRAAKDKSKEDIYSVAKSLEKSLRGVAAYFRQMAQYYFAICPKKDIPSGLC